MRFLAAGLALLGVLSILLPRASGMTIGLVVGILLLIAGIARVTFAWIANSLGSMFRRFTTGVLAILAGAEPVLLMEDGGARLTVTEEPDLAAEVRRAIEGFVRREWSKPGRNRRIEVELWNGKAVLKSPGVELLEEIGFRREYRGMVYDALQARARPVRDR